MPKSIVISLAECSTQPPHLHRYLLQTMNSHSPATLLNHFLSSADYQSSPTIRSLYLSSLILFIYHEASERMKEKARFAPVPWISTYTWTFWESPLFLCSASHFLLSSFCTMLQQRVLKSTTKTLLDHFLYFFCWTTHLLLQLLRLSVFHHLNEIQDFCLLLLVSFVFALIYFAYIWGSRIVLRGK